MDFCGFFLVFFVVQFKFFVFRLHDKRLACPFLLICCIFVYFVFSRKGMDQGIADEKMKEDPGIKSFTHRDDCALSGTVASLIHCIISCSILPS